MSNNFISQFKIAAEAVDAKYMAMAPIWGASAKSTNDYPYKNDRIVREVLQHNMELTIQKENTTAAWYAELYKIYNELNVCSYKLHTLEYINGGYRTSPQKLQKSFSRLKIVREEETHPKDDSTRAGLVQFVGKELPTEDDNRWDDFNFYVTECGILLHYTNKHNSAVHNDCGHVVRHRQEAEIQKWGGYFAPHWNLGNFPEFQRPRMDFLKKHEVCTEKIKDIRLLPNGEVRFPVGETPTVRYYKAMIERYK